MSYSVGDVASIAGVTVRALHHYDEVGLLSPSDRTPAGYRRYCDGDLERLQRILCYRELGFTLDDIASVLADHAVDAGEHLQRQRTLLSQRVGRLQRMVASLDKALEAKKMGINLDPHEVLEVFGDDNPTQYAEEAEQRWGDTDAYRESHRRTARYSKQDWLEIQAEAAAIERRLADVYGGGAAARSAEALDAVEAHRQHIGRWFYDCSCEMHRALGEMYVADERFTAHYDALAPGLAPYVRDATVANAERGDR